MEKMNKKKNICISVIIFIIILINVFFIKKYIIYNLKYTNLFYQKEDLKKTEVIYLDSIGFPNDITCTGFTYDEEDNSFWIVDNGIRKDSNNILPLLYEINLDEKKILKIIEIPNLEINSNIQGITYDNSNESLWLADKKKILNVDKSGKLLKVLDIPGYENVRFNGISYDHFEETLHILCADKFYFSLNKNGEIINKYRCNYNEQDQMYRYNNKEYITIGADYYGNNNYLACFTNDVKLEKIYTLNESYAIEGVIIKDNKVYILNDGFFHNSKINCNYIVIYDLPDE